LLGRKLHVEAHRQLKISFSAADGEIIRSDEEARALLSRKHIHFRVKREIWLPRHIDVAEMIKGEGQGLGRRALLIQPKDGVNLQPFAASLLDE
jgi:hypothetical protein